MAAIQVGGGISIVQPDYEDKTICGFSIYGNYDFTPHIGIEGDIHIANVITPTGISQSSYLLGPRYVFNKGRYHPYAKGLLGLGVFTFEASNGHPSSSSTHKMYAFGGGLDFTAKRRLNVRAFDLEYQRWPGFTTNGLTPLAITVGAAYRF